LGSQEFTGSVAGRRYWANYLRENLEVLLAISAEHLKTAHERAQKQVEAERRADAQILVDAFSKKTYEGDYRFGVGFFHAVYDPSVGTLTVTVPVRFDFKDSDSRSVKVTNAGKPDQKVEFVTEHLNWGSDNTGRWESEVWKEKFIGLVQPFWSRHVLACSRPGWESLRARVVVRVDDVPLNEPRPGIIEPRLVNVYRGDTPSGTEFVTKGSAELSYADVDPMFPGLHPVAVHEFGHMLGFDDEYAREGFPAYALHSDLVQDEFGYGVPRLDSSRTDVFKDSIMSSGMGLKSGNVLVEHGVLFLAALRQISGIREWKLRLQ
jgi:hypothetical protein